VTPNVPNDCPIPDARTRILERRQTEDGFGRNFYYVEITYLGDQEPAHIWVQSSDNSEKGGTEVERVDAEKVLEYVSSRELERYENEQFKIEADAQAVADREEEQEQVRKRMAKNARMADSGRGRGSTMLDALDIDPELQATTKTRGRPRGRGRLRGRGRGRGSWRARGGVTSGAMRVNEITQDEIIDSEPSQPDMQETETMGSGVLETSSESEDDLPEPTSPGLMRSAFVTNSALPMSPVQQYRPGAPAALLRTKSMPDIDGDDDIALEIDDNESLLSDAMQLQVDGGHGDNINTESDTADLSDRDRRGTKRSRMESTTPQHTLMFPPSSQIEVPESGDSSTPPDHLPSSVEAHQYNAADYNTHLPLRTGLLSSQHAKLSPGGAPDNSKEEFDDKDAEEYVVEAINEHYYDDDGRKFYLVKWQGYEDSYDWLPKEDLEGAAELVHKYDESIKRNKGKTKREYIDS
jgi:hypothetical protein